MKLTRKRAIEKAIGECKITNCHYCHVTGIAVDYGIVLGLQMAAKVDRGCRVVPALELMIDRRLKKLEKAR